MGTYEPPPSHQYVDELVRPAGSNIGSDLSLGDKLPDEISITFGDPVRCQSCIDRMHPILTSHRLLPPAPRKLFQRLLVVAYSNH